MGAGAITPLTGPLGRNGPGLARGGGTVPPFWELRKHAYGNSQADVEGPGAVGSVAEGRFMGVNLR